ncbi:MAG: response regulator [bacterium]
MDKPTRILIVDDDSAARVRIKEALLSGHFLFEEASDGVEGLQKVYSFHPDLILLDVVMPRMDGLKMSRFLQQNTQTCEIPVIMMTASKESADALREFHQEANDFIDKPFRDTDLLSRVRRQVKIKEELDRLMSEKETLDVIRKMIHTLGQKKSMYDLLYTLVKSISENIEVERCSMVRVREDQRTGVVEASSDAPDIRNMEIDLGKYPEIIKVLDTKQILFIQNIGEDPIMAPVRDHLKKIRFHSLVLFPVIVDDRILGTLLLRTARSKKTFSERELQFLRAVVDAARPAIMSAHLFEKVEERLLSAPMMEENTPDSRLQYNLPQTEKGIEIMDQIQRIKDEIRYLKLTQKEIREQKSPHFRESNEK